MKRVVTNAAKIRTAPCADPEDFPVGGGLEARLRDVAPAAEGVREEAAGLKAM